MATVNISHHYRYYQGKPREATESAPQNMPKEKKKTARYTVTTSFIQKPSGPTWPQLE